MRAGKGQEGTFLLLLALPLMMNVLGKGVKRPERIITFRKHSDDSIMCEFLLCCFNKRYDCRKNFVRLYELIFS